MTTHNGLNNRNLDIEKNGSVVEPLTEALNFNSDDFVVSSPSDGRVNIVIRDRVMNNNVSRSFNTNYVIDSLRDVLCNYTFRFNPSTSLLGGSFARIDIQIRPDSSSSFTTVASAESGIFGGLILGIAINTTNNVSCSFYVPRGYEVRLNQTGTASASLQFNQEILL